MKKLIMIAIITMMLEGCITKEMNVIVQPTKQYEGRYSNAEELKNAVADIKLTEGESVWVLSNVTLKRLLKNTEKSK